jgi:endonuclease G, mitochondrial
MNSPGMTGSSGTGVTGAGFDPGFLGVPVPLPVRGGVGLLVLGYTHFSVVFDPVRRFAAATAVIIEGALIRDLPREGIDWVLDPRLDASSQAGEEVYAGNNLDRGHLVRRRDPTWGETVGVADRANRETFTYTNAAPQVGVFNQSQSLWAGLEDYILGHAVTYGRRLIVMTGPVLDPADPPYRGIQIPLRFWKVAAFTTTSSGGTVLGATGYILDQSPYLPPVDTLRPEMTPTPVDPDQVPPLGPYRTYQVPITDITTMTGLDLGPLPSADRYRAPQPVTAAGLDTTPTDHPAAWRALTTTADITL